MRRTRSRCRPSADAVRCHKATWHDSSRQPPPGLPWPPSSCSATSSFPGPPQTRTNRSRQRALSRRRASPLGPSRPRALQSSPPSSLLPPCSHTLPHSRTSSRRHRGHRLRRKQPPFSGSPGRPSLERRRTTSRSTRTAFACSELGRGWRPSWSPPSDGDRKIRRCCRPGHTAGTSGPFEEASVIRSRSSVRASS